MGHGYVYNSSKVLRLLRNGVLVPRSQKSAYSREEPKVSVRRHGVESFLNVSASLSQFALWKIKGWNQTISESSSSLTFHGTLCATLSYIHLLTFPCFYNKIEMSKPITVP